MSLTWEQELAEHRQALRVAENLIADRLDRIVEVEWDEDRRLWIGGEHEIDVSDLDPDLVEFEINAIPVSRCFSRLGDEYAENDSADAHAYFRGWVRPGVACYEVEQLP